VTAIVDHPRIIGRCALYDELAAGGMATGLMIGARVALLVASAAASLGCDAIFGIDDHALAAGAASDDSGSTPVSCAPGGKGMNDCGSGSASCCASPEIPGGTYDRSYDGLVSGNLSTAYPAMVSGFRLDQYEVTVGRFRQFVGAVVDGWLPQAGSGKHTHLNEGHGLNATGGGFEGGWDASWNGDLATTQSGWTNDLSCDNPDQTWTPSPGNNEKLPIGCESWYAAYAFCIWDGGFLPSEAEWDYAAAGGSEQRAYPWSLAYPPGSTAISCTNANFSVCPAEAPNAVGSESPAGDGKWGQSDLGGNVWEWNLDWYAGYVTPCTDCVNLTADTTRVVRGGGFGTVTTGLLASGRYSVASGRDDVGIRCARIP
jgi:sulfatase modifying factor 1